MSVPTCTFFYTFAIRKLHFFNEFSISEQNLYINLSIKNYYEEEQNDAGCSCCNRADVVWWRRWPSNVWRQ